MKSSLKYQVKYYSRWNGYSNIYEYEYFDTIEEAENFAKSNYDSTIYKRVPSPSYINSNWTYERI